MATITASTVTLQPVSSLSSNPGTGTYPTSGSGFTTVSMKSGDTLVIPVQKYSSTNHSYSPTGSVGTTSGSASTQSGSYSSSTSVLNVTVSNIDRDGSISIFCPPSDGGISNGYRARVQVNFTLDTTFSLSSSNVNVLDSDTYYQLSLSNSGNDGLNNDTIYYAFNNSSIANGTNINSYFSAGSNGYVARTFTTAETKPFSTTGSLARIYNALPTTSSNPKTITIYAANLSGQNSVNTGATYTVTLVAQPPTVSASKAIITNGFSLTANPSGSTSGTVTYQWSTVTLGPQASGHYSTGYTSNANLGVGTEWVGTTWRCQARATVNKGSTYVYSNTSDVTLPTYSVSAPSSIQEGQSGTFTVSSSNGLGPIYWQVTTSSGGDFSTSTGQVGSGSASSGSFTVSPTSDSSTEGTETATVKLYLNNTFNNLNYVHATDTFNITDPPPPITAPTVNSGTWTQHDVNGNESEHAGVTIAWSGGQNGTLQLAVSKTNSAPSSGWVTDTDQSSPGLMYYDSNGDQLDRGTTYYLWARRSTTAVSSSVSSTAPYLPISDNSITIGVPTDKNGNALSTNVSGVYIIPNTYGTASGDNILIPYSGGGSPDQYRIVSSDTQDYWLNTQNGTSGTFVLEQASSGGSYSELPAANQTFTYTFEGRRPPTNGGHPSTANAYWVSVDGTQVRRLFRESSSTYSVSSPNSVNEGQNLVFTITTTNVPDNTTVAWTLGGTIQSGDYTTNDTSPATITNNSATVTFSIINDNVADGNKTATLTLANLDSANNPTGNPSSTTTIVDTSNPGSSGGSGSISGGSAGQYGIQIKNFAGSQVIIDDTSRITNFLGTATFNSATSTSETLFSTSSNGGAFDCSSVSTTGFIVTWTGALYSQPTITRRSSSLKGITVTKNANDTNSNTSGIATIELVRY